MTTQLAGHCHCGDKDGPGGNPLRKVPRAEGARENQCPQDGGTGLVPPRQPHPVRQAFALSGGVALFLAGDAWFRYTLRIGTPWLRLATAVFALAVTALGATVAVEAQLAVLLCALVAMLAGERYVTWRWPVGWLRRGRAGGWEA